MYNDVKSRLMLARQLAAEGIVLLKNDEGCLPLKEKTEVALLGRTQNDTVIGGGGSGCSYSENTLLISNELEAAGVILEPGFDRYYKELRDFEKENPPANDFAGLDLEGLVNSGLLYEIFGKYNPPITEPVPDKELFENASKAVETAIFVIGRTAGGEECDRRIKDDYCISENEREIVKLASEYFSEIIVVLNVNGPVDLFWTNDFPKIKAVLFMGSCGEQGAGALADILTGRVSPSGRLAQTFALSYEDYPTSANMSFDKDNLDSIKRYSDYGLSAADNGSTGFDISPVTYYYEDIYVGYRYFDSVDKPVMYPFGFGLSYADFKLEIKAAKIIKGSLSVDLSVKNISEKYSGREVIQLYLRAPSGKINKPYKELKAIEKTKELKPGECTELNISAELQSFASFDEERKEYIIEKGIYEVLISDGIETCCAANIIVKDDIVVRRLYADIGINPVNAGKAKFMRLEGISTAIRDCISLSLSAKDIICREPADKKLDLDAAAKKSVLKDVINGEVKLEEFVAQLSPKELAVLCAGYGSGLPFGGFGKKYPSSLKYDDGSDIAYNSHETAMPGYVSPAFEKYGIYSTFYKDGPASVGKTAWPTGMMLGCTFNKELLEAFGETCGMEAKEQMVDAWLAPGINMMRNPLSGRVFEYFSEDPYLTGICGVSISAGAMKIDGLTVCPKHFALNEQETFRRGSSKLNIDAVDSIVSARAAREIYLAPFEMLITKAKPRMLMTSFNKINGVFAAGNKTLCTDILRGEWGFEGVVVTDWGDMDMVVDGADAVAAGNDVVMPGGPPVMEQILKGFEEGRVSLAELRNAACHMLGYVIKSGSFIDKIN